LLVLFELLGLLDLFELVVLLDDLDLVLLDLVLDELRDPFRGLLVQRRRRDVRLGLGRLLRFREFLEELFLGYLLGQVLFGEILFVVVLLFLGVFVVFLVLVGLRVASVLGFVLLVLLLALLLDGFLNLLFDYLLFG